MARSIMWTRSWSPLLCLIFYFTAVSWLVPWNSAVAVASPDPVANISPEIKNAAEDLSNDELHALLSLLAGTNSKVNPPDTILLSDSLTTAQTPVLASTSAPTPSTTTTPSTPSSTPSEKETSEATTTSTPPTTTKPRVIIVPVTPATTTTTTTDPQKNPRVLASPPQNDLAQQLSLLNTLLGTQGGNGGTSQGHTTSGLDNNAAAEAAAALFGVAPAALIIPATTSTTTTTTTTPRPLTTVKPIGTLDDTSAALQSLALLNVLLGNTGGNNGGNNSAAAALLGLGTASSSPAVRQTPAQSSAQKEQELQAAQLTNLLLQSAAAGGQANPQLQNFVNSPSAMDASASNQLSGLLGILGTLGSLGGQQQQSPALFNLGQNPLQQQQQPNLLGNIFGGQAQGQSHRHNPQAQQQANLLASLFGGNTTPAPSLPGFGILSSMANLGSTIFSTVTNTFGGSRGDGRPRVRGVDTRLGLGYRFGDNADAQLMWEIGPQLFTEPLKEDANGVARKRQAANGQGLLGSASSRVMQMFKPQSQYPQNHPNYNNPPWRRSDTPDDSIVSKESLTSVASSLPHQSLKTLHALLNIKKNQGTTPATTPESKRRSSLFSWYTSTTPVTPRKIHIPAQLVGPPTSKFDNVFSWFNKPSTTAASPNVHIPSTQMTPPKSSALDKFVSWYMGGSTVPSTTEASSHNLNSYFFSPTANHDNMNMDPSNFLKRSSMTPFPPTAPAMRRNYYDKRQINPKTNIHSSLTTYEKYLLGMLSDDDVNKSQDLDLMTSSTNTNGNNALGNANRRNNIVGQNARNGNNFSGERNSNGQQQRRNGNNFSGERNSNGQQQRRNGNNFSGERNSNGQQQRRNGNNFSGEINLNGQQQRRNGNNFSGEKNLIGQLRRNNAMNFRRNHFVHPPLTNAPYLNRQANNNNNPNFTPNRRPGIGNQFNFESHNKIVSMKGPLPPRMRRPGPASTVRPPGMGNFGMRRRFGPQKPPPFSNRKSGFSFSSLNPFAGLFGKKNRPPNNFMHNQQQQHYAPMDQNYGMTEMSNIDSYNPYSAYDHQSFHKANPPNKFDTSGNSNEQALANIRKLLANSKPKKVSKEESSQVEDTPTADSNIQSTKVKYNPHQNFIPEAEDSYLRRNAMVTNPKLREAELEKLFGEVKGKNDTKPTTGEKNRKSDDYDSETESSRSAYLMGLVKNVLNTRIKAKINNKEKNIPSISIITDKPILPRPKPKRQRIRTKLKITNGKPEIVVLPEPQREMKPIVHVGEDMSFEDLKEFYDGVVTTTKKPKEKKKKKPKTKKTELVINDDDEIELSEEEEDSKEVFIDIASGEVSVLKPVASLTSFDPPKEDSPEEEEEIILDEETKRKQEIYNNLQKQLQSSYEKMKKAQLRAMAKQKRKEELAAKGLDESLDMVSKYFDLVEEGEKESDKVNGKTHHDPMRQESQRHPYLSPPPLGHGFRRSVRSDPKGYTTSTPYSQLRKNR